MPNKVYVVTGKEDDDCESLVRFEEATDAQLAMCDRVVFDKNGVMIRRISPNDTLRIIGDIAMKRAAVVRSLEEKGIVVCGDEPHIRPRRRVLQ